MLFKFPQKKIVLECFTTRQSILETAPVTPAVKHFPNWWKALPNSYREKSKLFEPPTMKSCAGMVDYYRKSIVLPLWSDLAVDIQKDLKEYRWQFSDGKSVVSYHDIDAQAKGFMASYVHLKIMSPWIFKCKEDINWVWSHPAYNYQDSNYVASLPAIVSYKQQSETNINILISNEKTQKILIPQGQPMVFMTPMSDRKVEIIRHLVSKEEYEKMLAPIERISFRHKFYNIVKRKEQFKDCPFKNHLR